MSTIINPHPSLTFVAGARQIDFNRAAGFRNIDLRHQRWRRSRNVGKATTTAEYSLKRSIRPPCVIHGSCPVTIAISSKYYPLLYNRPFKRVITMMVYFFDFLGRGDSMIAHDKYYQLEPDPGAVLLLTQSYGRVEFVIGYARSAIVEKWGCYCFNSFKRVSDPALQRSWAQPHESDLVIYRAVSVYLVKEEPWMDLSE